MTTQPLSELAQRFTTTSLRTVQDTTDISAFQEYMTARCKDLPIAVILLYSFIHVMFNQRHLLVKMVKENTFLCEAHWVHWDRLRLQAIVATARVQHLTCRSSNYRSTALRHIV